MGKLIYSGNEVINLRELLRPTFKLNLGIRMEGYDRSRTFTLFCKLLAKCILMGGGGACLCDFCETSTLGLWFWYCWEGVPWKPSDSASPLGKMSSYFIWTSTSELDGRVSSLSLLSYCSRTLESSPWKLESENFPLPLSFVPSCTLFLPLALVSISNDARHST